MSSSRPLADMTTQFGSSDPSSVDGDAGYGARGAARRLAKRQAGELSLRRTIESEVIPRLMLAHRAGPMRFKSSPPAHAEPHTEDVIEFTRLILAHAEPSVAAEYIEVLRKQDISVESIFLDLLAPSARLLGEMWIEDTCDFSDVTVGLAQLRQLLHKYSPEFEDEAEIQVIGLRALLAPTPGDQHTFGIGMVEKFFQRAGWSVQSFMSIDAAKLTVLVRKRHFDVVGLSLSCEGMLSDLTTTIEDIRKASKNRDVCILVGGPVFLSQPELVSRVGADATAVDGRQAVRQVAYARAAKTLRAHN
jgi:MerR family transcriptional regulator, light-induced transcriptional regulator